MPDQISITNPKTSILERAKLPRLFESLRNRGYQVVGPTVRDGAIIYDTLTGPDQLPAGWTDEQDGGTYRLKKRNDAALFGYAVGPHSWKKFLFLPKERLFRARRTRDGFEVLPEGLAPPKLAFLGVRSCEIHAIAIQDKVFLGGPFADRSYQLRRENVFIVAVNCGQAGGTCFCVSMETGPKVTWGFDLALTEILDGARHYFVVESGSDEGAEILAELSQKMPNESELAAAEATVARAAAEMGRTLETDGIKELLYRTLEHPRWDDVAARCLSCANCTLVCPTCFCSNVEETNDLTGEHAERWRKWDSCFTVGFSHLAGGDVRASVKSRYRQWLTHKVGTWVDQFGTSGCVGCGRCITWCPVAIDLTEEVRALRAPQNPPNEPKTS